MYYLSLVQAFTFYPLGHIRSFYMETNEHWHFPPTGREGDAERTVHWDNALTGLSLLNRLWDFLVSSVNSPSPARPYAPWEAQVEGCYAALPRRQIILLLLRPHDSAAGYFR